MQLSGPRTVPRGRGRVVRGNVQVQRLERRRDRVIHVGAELVAWRFALQEFRLVARVQVQRNWTGSHVDVVPGFVFRVAPRPAAGHVPDCFVPAAGKDHREHGLRFGFQRGVGLRFVTVLQTVHRGRQRRHAADLIEPPRRIEEPVQPQPAGADITRRGKVRPAVLALPDVVGECPPRFGHLDAVDPLPAGVGLPRVRDEVAHAGRVADPVGLDRLDPSVAQFQQPHVAVDHPARFRHAPEVVGPVPSGRVKIRRPAIVVNRVGQIGV